MNTEFNAILSAKYEINSPPKTVFLMVGPPNCGKSHFSKELSLQYTYLGYKTKILSSDDLRREMLVDMSRDKFSPEMMHMSEAAFEILFKEYELAMRFPQNLDYIIVDTTGIAKEFRDKIVTLAKQAHYRIEMVLFNYDETKDYFKLGANKMLTSKFLTRMRQETMKELNRKAYENIHKIRKVSFPQVTYKGLQNLRNIAKPISSFVLTDVHGCYTEMVELLAKKGFEVDPETQKVKDLKPAENHINHLIFGGDLIDKGPDSRKMIEFQYANLDVPWIFFVRCNHANFIYKKLKGLLEDVEPEVVAKFDSYEMIANDEELKQKFLACFEAALPYYRNQKIIVTHSPCENVYLEKGTETAIKHMRMFRYPKAEDVGEGGDFNKALTESLDFIRRDAVRNHPYHIFGHVSFERIFQYKNKIGLDTGCYAGNALSMVEIPHYDSKPYFHSVPSRQPKQEGKVFACPAFGEEEVSLDSLEGPDLRRIRFMAMNKVNFVSGTVSPADKDVEANNLESLRKGLDYYRELGYRTLQLEPKYMGSRCNMYLSFTPQGDLDLENCFATSRQGYKIRSVDLTGLFEKTAKRIKERVFPQFENVMLVVLDGELMPWSALGTPLIDKSFLPIRDAVVSEMDLLEQSGFEGDLAEVRLRAENSGFNAEYNTTPKKELVEKYGNSNFSTYRALKHFQFEGVAKHRELAEIYSGQIDFFSANTELDYLPWSILKLESMNREGNMEIYHNLTPVYYRYVNEEAFCHEVLIPSNLTPEEIEEEYKKAEAFYAEITEKRGMEGVVIKPQSQLRSPGHAPYIKVRNPKYLTLVYGYDYLLPEKYAKLMRQKSIRSKMRVSAKEAHLASEMLKIPSQEISLENKVWVNLAAQLVLEEKKEKSLDPRL